MKLISEKKGTELLTLARASIFNEKSRVLDTQLSPFGAFITLFVNGKERGCAGNPYPKSSLNRLVQECAIFAATKDPRFPKINNNESNDTDILLSILTYPKVIKPEEIIIGVHGLIVTQGSHSALHLPHVAKEYGWDVETLLQKTCLKGDLPKDAWKQDVEISSFETQRFFEELRTKKIPPIRKIIPPI
ncbi:MAG: AmmeMemoRadiSam system protein A [Simkaniaceae bacterium]|nr:MAG: AmmeMemoRadiSam system protein A [Simkaniaceae bacterium]